MRLGEHEQRIQDGALGEPPRLAPVAQALHAG